MSNNRQKNNLDNVLMGLLESPQGLSYLASLENEQIKGIGQDLVKENVFGDVDLLTESIRSIWKDGSIQEFMAHSVWCFHREAVTRLFQESETDREDIRYDFIDTGNLLLNSGKPVIAVSPMTLCTEDAVRGIIATMERYQPKRKFILYGEEMGSFLERNSNYQSLFAGDNISGIRRILQVLKEGGIFFTYPDFVYDTHNAVSGELFGVPRSFSAGFIKIILHSGAILQPLTANYKKNKIELRFYESIDQALISSDLSLDISIKEKIMARVIARILEALILKVPNQWRLLPTLTHEVERAAVV